MTEISRQEYAGLFDGPPETSMTTCVELGHALGNRHWPAVVKGTRVYVPLTVDRASPRTRPACLEPPRDTSTNTPGPAGEVQT